MGERQGQEEAPVFERECAVYAFLLGYARRLVADIDDAQFADQPTPGVNHPAWLLGHLAISTDFAATKFGLAPCQPRSWFKDFSSGSFPRPDRASYPGKAELMAAYEAGHERVEKAALAATPEAMDQPHGLEIAGLKEALPTVGHLVVHLMTAHEASHLGHLSNWRRQKGLPFLF